MLIRRLLLFFGIFFELSLLDSITVLPIFFSSNEQKHQQPPLPKKKVCCWLTAVKRLRTVHGRLHLHFSCPLLLTTTTPRRCLYQEVGLAVQRGRARIYKWLSTRRWLFTDVMAQSVSRRKCVSPCPSLTATEKPGCSGMLSELFIFFFRQTP